MSPPSTPDDTPDDARAADDRTADETTDGSTPRSPPAWRQAAAITLGAVAVVFLGYSVVVAQQLLLGAIAFGCLLALSAVAWYGHRSDVARVVVTWVVVLAVALYGLFSRQFPLGVIAAAVVYLVAWVTGPRSPWNRE